jgi:SnoaL-like polyketide cyclase
VSLCSVTFTGALGLPNGTVIEPTGKAFEVVVSTIARWWDGKILEEHILYENASLRRQIGLG